LSAFDMDGDGVIDGKDALIVMRHLLGFTGDELVANLSLNAPRNTATKITTYLASGCPIDPAN
jgi:predicted GNAT family N-acyltransferase